MVHPLWTLPSGLCDADESCQRFMERCLPECFYKLLNNGAVRRWGLEIQEGVFNMLDLLTNLVIVRLKHGPVPETLLKNVYALVCCSRDCHDGSCIKILQLCNSRSNFHNLFVSS